MVAQDKEASDIRLSHLAVAVVLVALVNNLQVWKAQVLVVLVWLVL
jgi:hypothetical protein